MKSCQKSGLIASLFVIMLAACSFDTQALRGDANGDASDDARLTSSDARLDGDVSTFPLGGGAGTAGTTPSPAGGNGGAPSPGGTGGAGGIAQNQMGGVSGGGGMPVGTGGASPPPPVPTCADGRCKVLAYGGHHYVIDFVRTSWTQASLTTCKKYGGTLAVITSADEDQTLSMFAMEAVRARVNALPDPIDQWKQNNGVWLGASDQVTEDVWQWVTGEPFGYANWGLNQPDSGRIENFLVMRVYEATPTKWADSREDFEHFRALIYVLCELAF